MQDPDSSPWFAQGGNNAAGSGVQGSVQGSVKISGSNISSVSIGLRQEQHQDGQRAPRATTQPGASGVTVPHSDQTQSTHSFGPSDIYSRGVMFEHKTTMTVCVATRDVVSWSQKADGRPELTTQSQTHIDWDCLMVAGIAGGVVVVGAMALAAPVAGAAALTAGGAVTAVGVVGAR